LGGQASGWVHVWMCVAGRFCFDRVEGGLAGQTVSETVLLFYFFDLILILILMLNIYK
jgi:hypothetical protein